MRLDRARIGNVLSVNGYLIVGAADDTHITLTWTLSGVGLDVTGNLYARI